MCDQPDTPTAAVLAFTIKKAKTAKDVLDKKAPAAGIATPALRFLQAEKQTQQVYTCDRPDIPTSAVSALQFLRAEKRKQVSANGLTSCYPHVMIFM